MEFNLADLLASLHADIEQRLSTVRAAFAHPGTKGDASERVWLELLDTYLPKRYQVAKAHVVDSEGTFSHQIDVVVFDRQYSPFIFNYQGEIIVPAESVYAVFEAKQVITADNVSYAQQKIRSVRDLHRTSLPIPYVEGKYKAKLPGHIIGGLLSLESDWSPALGTPLRSALERVVDVGRLDLGCVAAQGHFFFDPLGRVYRCVTETKPATAFLFKLIAELQALGTVPMIDIEAYGRWLTPTSV